MKKLLQVSVVALIIAGGACATYESKYARMSDEQVLAECLAEIDKPTTMQNSFASAATALKDKFTPGPSVYLENPCIENNKRQTKTLLKAGAKVGETAR